MIVILKPSLDRTSLEYLQTLEFLQQLPGIEVQTNTIHGCEEIITEIYLLGKTQGISKENIEALPAVLRAIKISRDYQILGRQPQMNKGFEFEYNGVIFSQNNLNIFAGLCAVDNEKHVESMMKALYENGLVCTRMGAYKPRTSPYAFQGLGKSCLPYVFEKAGKYGIKVIAMEVTHQRHIDEIYHCLTMTGNPTGVMLQIGTRNAQNFELLREVGSQQTFPVLFKRGYGITLNESIHAAEYLAHAGNRKVIFCLRGVKSLFGAPHRNMVDFAHVPVIHRLTRMPVCIDPSHSVGILERTPDGLSDIYHVCAQGIISGANMILVDFHPNPSLAVVDSRQAISIHELPWFLEDIAIAREAFEKRRALACRFAEKKAVECIA
ncbi:MAG: 3-deoxy-7-phosphoheptulonate synthase [Proteobacteria bacterium]|nr:3-deoxy-7-phosphoheptulonate synthase [Pseudomonadota bacterium]